MFDPFLSRHIVAPLQYDISGALSPVGIRDQMIRGRMLADRLVDQGLVNVSTRRLLVVGAGAGGATAAIRAAELGVNTVLIDVEPAPFTRQKGCFTRWIDPAQYDWPLGHWFSASFPVAGATMPLAWGAGKAADVADVWALQLSYAAGSLPLRVLPNTAFLRAAQNGNFLDVDLSTRGVNAPTEQFGAMIYGIGQGTEQTSFGTYTGFRFWDNDPFEKDNLGLPPTSEPSVLISGGGDGALQDYLRVMTGMSSAKEIYSEIVAHSSHAIDWRAVQTRLQDAEDQAARAYLWAVTTEHDHAIISALHDVHRREADKLLDKWYPIEEAMRVVLRDPIPRIRLACRCNHFGRCYALNRFLVLLIDRFLHYRYKSNTIEFGSSLNEVQGIAPHICQNDPQACHGQRHRVTLVEARCDFRGTSLTHAGTYHVVIIRHGLAPPQTFFAGTGISFPRQILPYYIH